MGINVQQGAVNTLALTVAGLYIGIIPPAPTSLNGTPANIAGFVGNASYGPVNTPIPWSDYGSFQAAFGSLVNRFGDLGTAVSIAVQQGANQGYAVRVTDGTDTAATGKFGISGSNYAVMLTARYSGSAGNAFTATVGASQYPSALKVTLTTGLGAPEVFDGITTSSTLAFWTALAAAVNSGNSGLRPRSNYFLAATGSNTIATIPAPGTTLTLSGGTDGVSALTSGSYVGTDGVAGTRTGMYALRGTGVSVAALVDVHDNFTFAGGGAAPVLSGTDIWAAQGAFGLSERIYMISSAAAGDSPTNWVGFNAPGIAGAGGIYNLKVMFGDWPSWSDTVNGLVRQVSPQAFIVGRLCNQSPALSALNQPIYGVAGSQFANAGLVYSNLDIATIQNAGFDVIVPPGQGPGGLPIWTCATGNNCNYNPAAQGDNYSTMTNFIVSGLAQVGGLGIFIGQIITPQLLQTILALLNNWFNAMWKAGLIGNAQGTKPYQVVNTSTPTQMQNGITVISVKVQYGPILRELALNFQGGQTVQIIDQSTGYGS
jgi:hypothetical protein